MALNSGDHDGQLCVSATNASTFSTSLRAPTASQQPWELDFLLPEPLASSTTDTRSYFQDTSRKDCPRLHESELGYPSESEDTAKTPHSGEDWQDIPLSEYGASEFSSYFVDNVFSDKTTTISKAQSSQSPCGKLMALKSPKLRVHTATCTGKDLSESQHKHREDSSFVKSKARVVSPTTVDKKVLVTDSDLRLFSTSNMRELSGRKEKNSKHNSKKVNSTAPVATYRQLKRCASLEADFNDHFVRALKRTKSLDQASWSASTIDSRWYCGHPESFHRMQQRLLSPMHPSTSLGFNGANIYLPVHHQIGMQLRQQFQPQYEPPKRKIGIYSPAERRERLKRFHEKRKLRVYHKRIKYDCRKRLANSCPRIKGRFVRKSEFLQAKESDSISSPATSESTSNTEDCQL
ncbi:hypothetical protein F443_18871 [Phytophthora nicotianae P1569]|uniref:CCT domain-containing protein n=1 Tax=Phytophthora nicotianae P1569 TaxID=1317065 RepID=V9E6I0_PHYNI|nr:hypothetical protein F443_18871 [Phytophthora nicotianae P1569]